MIEQKPLCGRRKYAMPRPEPGKLGPWQQIAPADRTSPIVPGSFSNPGKLADTIAIPSLELFGVLFFI
jgi:hypothetical protein